MDEEKYFEDPSKELELQLVEVEPAKPKFDARAYLDGMEALQDMKRQARWLKQHDARRFAPPPVIPGEKS